MCAHNQLKLIRETVKLAKLRKWMANRAKLRNASKTINYNRTLWSIRSYLFIGRNQNRKLWLNFVNSRNGSIWRCTTSLWECKWHTEQQQDWNKRSIRAFTDQILINTFIVSGIHFFFLLFRPYVFALIYTVSHVHSAVRCYVRLPATECKRYLCLVATQHAVMSPMISAVVDINLLAGHSHYKDHLIRCDMRLPRLWCG